MWVVWQRVAVERWGWLDGGPKRKGGCGRLMRFGCRHASGWRCPPPGGGLAIQGSLAVHVQEVFGADERIGVQGDIRAEEYMRVPGAADEACRGCNMLSRPTNAWGCNTI